MHLAQSKETTAQFLAVLTQHLKQVNPGYMRNKHAKGIRYEFLREVEPGVYASHNVICERGTYYHGFCLTLHRHVPKLALYSPFTIGGRFNHNYSVNRAFQQDLGRSPTDPVSPFRLSDSHRFRPGTEGIIHRCTAEAEAHLLPYYLSVWQRSRPALDALLAFLRHGYDVHACVQEALGGRWNTTELDCDLPRYAALFFSVPLGNREALLKAVVGAKSELFAELSKQGEPDAAPHGGPAAPVSNSGVTDGPPSVS
jgi:hypothetical protein